MSKQQQWMRNRAGGPLHKADISCESNGCWPVAVIDAEDREQVERLVHSFWDNGTDDADDAAAMRAALRAFADPKPPKPEEPTGLGAVVEDAEGVKWVRVEPHDARNSLAIAAWRSRVPQAVPREYSWPNIAAVRVLSEGVVA